MNVVASPAPADAWENIVRADAGATFFQTPAWAGLVSKMGNGFKDKSLLLRFPDESMAVVPRMCRTIGSVFREVESVPLGLYGSPISERPLTAVEMREVGGLFLPPRAAVGVLIETPGAPLELNVPRKTISTHILRLSPGTDEDALMRRYRKGHRSAVRQAAREGVLVGRAQTLGDFQEYHAVYLATVERWTRRPATIYSADFFRGIFEASQTDERVRLWLARAEGNLLAGALVLHQGRTAAYWHGASTEEGRRRNAGNAAVHAAIMDGVRQGRDSFDFMPSSGLADVEHFKAGFGAEITEVGMHHFAGSAVYRFLSGAKARLRARTGGTFRND